MKNPTARKIALGLTLAATALTGTAWAEQAAKPAKPAPVTMTRAEAQTKAVAKFAELDVNKDGKLDRADHEARREARRTAAFDRMDADKNGQLSRAEFTAAPQRGEGREGAGREGWGNRRGGPDGPGGHRGHGRHFGGGRGGPDGGFGGMADANKDGAVTQAEFTAAALQRFDRADANKDGKVTPEEHQAARQAMREQWRANRAERQAQPATAPATK